MICNRNIIEIILFTVASDSGVSGCVDGAVTVATIVIVQSVNIPPLQRYGKKFRATCITKTSFTDQTVNINQILSKRKLFILFLGVSPAIPSFPP